MGMRRAVAIESWVTATLLSQAGPVLGVLSYIESTIDLATAKIKYDKGSFEVFEGNTQKEAGEKLAKKWGKLVELPD